MDRRNVELRAILDITQAINENSSEEVLYKSFQFTCMSLLVGVPLSLMVVDQNGVFFPVNPVLKFTDRQSDYIIELVQVSDTRRISVLDDDKLEGVEMLMRIRHKDKLLAVVVVGESSSDVTDHQLNLVKTLANIVMVAIENKRLTRSQIAQEVMNRELSIARKVQRNLVPEYLPKNETFELFASYTPFGEVGGDYYDYIQIDDNEFLFCIGDVQGKGVPAAMVMSNFQASFKALSRQGADLRTIVEGANALLYTAAKGSHFITFFVGKVDLKSRSLTYINAGHNPPILMRENGESKYLSEGTMILGALEDLVFVNVGVEPINANDLVFTFTDGVTEVFNEDNDEFGEDRLCDVVKTERQKSLPEIQEILLRSLNGFKGTHDFSDDLTTLMLRVF